MEPVPPVSHRHQGYPELEDAVVQELNNVATWLQHVASGDTKERLLNMVRFARSVVRDEMNAEEEYALDLVALRSGQLLDTMSTLCLCPPIKRTSGLDVPAELSNSQKRVPLFLSDANSTPTIFDTSVTAGVPRIVNAPSDGDRASESPSDATLAVVVAEGSATLHVDASTFVDGLETKKKPTTYLDALVSAVTPSSSAGVGEDVAATSVPHHEPVGTHRPQHQRLDSVDTTAAVVVCGNDAVTQRRAKITAKPKRIVAQRTEVPRGCDSLFSRALRAELPRTDDEMTESSDTGALTRPQQTSDIAGKRQPPHRKTALRKKDALLKRQHREAADNRMLDDAIRRNAEYHQSVTGSGATSCADTSLPSTITADVSPFVLPESEPQLFHRSTQAIVGLFIAFATTKKSLTVRAERCLPSFVANLCW